MKWNRYDTWWTILDRMKKKVEHIDQLSSDGKKSKWRQLIVVNNKFVMRSVNYDPSLPEKLIKYFNEPAYKIVNWEKKACDYPTLQWFRAKHWITLKQWNDWVSNYDELSHARDIINEFKYDKLITNGLNGKYNAQIVKLVAQNELWMSDKIETKNVWEITDTQRKNMIKEYLESLKSWEVYSIEDNKE
jgi:hypothetical protein